MLFSMPTNKTQMKDEARKLVFVKLLHTIIWAIMVAAIFSILYAGASGSVTTTTYISMGLMAFEGLALLVGKGNCPLTPIARQYSASTKDNFDIYLPEWLASHNKAIFGALLAIGLVMLAFRFH
jgi:hypothetical protein